MTDRLVASDHLWGRGIHIGWYLEDEDDGGGTLGHISKELTKAPPVQYSENNEGWIATYAIAKAFPTVEIEPSYGFSFESLVTARKALKVGLAAIEYAKANRKLEEWETKALAAGWTPPKAKGKKR